MDKHPKFDFGKTAQELSAHGFDLYYFNSKKQGELDFVIEKNGAVLPIEVKSGKDYHRHNALSNVMSNLAATAAIQRSIAKKVYFCSSKNG